MWGTIGGGVACLLLLALLCCCLCARRRAPAPPRPDKQEKDHEEADTHSVGSSADSTSVEAGLVSGTPKQQRSALQRIWDGIAGNSHRQSAPQVAASRPRTAASTKAFPPPSAVIEMPGLVTNLDDELQHAAGASETDPGKDNFFAGKAAPQPDKPWTLEDRAAFYHIAKQGYDLEKLGIPQARAEAELGSVFVAGLTGPKMGAVGLKRNQLQSLNSGVSSSAPSTSAAKAATPTAPFEKHRDLMRKQHWNGTPPPHKLETRTNSWVKPPNVPSPGVDDSPAYKPWEMTGSPPGPPGENDIMEFKLSPSPSTFPKED